MRGTFRLRQIANAIRHAWLTRRAHHAVANFPQVRRRMPHGMTASLIVTLTSYPLRFPHLSKTLKSLLDQTIQADRTILWVAKQDYSALPPDVLALQSMGLEIFETEDLRSYKKLIPALQRWPEAHFVTADDDVYYPPHWLSGLVTSAKLYPRDVIAARVHLAKIGPSGNFDPYNQWTLASHLDRAPDTYSRLFPTGVGGVLYPAGTFHPTVMDCALFQELAPQGDDIWFFWMARLAGTQQRRADMRFDIVEWPNSQDVALCNENMLGDGNDQQIKAMFDHFGPVP